MSTIDEILRLFAAKGRAAYHGEAVSQTEHALQAAHLAATEGAPPSLIAAALLHDIGHLLAVSEDLAERGIDGRHEAAGASWLARHFGAEVIEPIRLHVAAKRYLCAVDPAYRARLSPASLRSLALQGGPMRDDEVAQFEANPHHPAALRLRRWDDEAKVPGRAVPGLDHYRATLEAVVLRYHGHLLR
jgi:phosphonate degradation associated HDIG domain protein